MSRSPASGCLDRLQEPTFTSPSAPLSAVTIPAPSVHEPITRCLVLAAGRGTRVNGAEDCKPLERVGGLALIERTILTASRAGLTDFYVVTGYAADRLEAFLDDLASRRGLAITAIRSDGWEAGNAASLLAARSYMAEPFALLMADHVFDDAILSGLLAAPLDADVVLACDDRVGSSAWTDDAEATKVRTEGDRIVAIGKDLEPYDAYDSGIFLCTPAIFAAVEERIRAGDASLSAAVGLIASQGRAAPYPVGPYAWIDVDTPQDRAMAERLLSSQLTKPNDGWVASHLNRPLSRRVFTPLLLRLVPGVTPNQVSALSLAVAGGAGLGFFLGQPLLGAALVQLASVLDGSDGEIARLKKMESPFGGFLDSLFDRIGDSLILFGMAYFAWQTAQSATLFGAAWPSLVLLVAMLAIIGNFMVSYTSARALVDLDIRYRGRWIAAGRGRDLRLLVLAVAGVLAVVYPISVFIGLVVVAILTNAIVWRRVVIAARLTGQGPPIDAASVRAVVFDFDGTVADTMPFLTDLATPLLTRHYGISSADAAHRYQETSGADFATQIAEMFPGHPANATVVAQFEAAKAAAILSQPPFEETVPTLRALGERGFGRFIVSSSSHETVKAYADRHGLAQWVDGLYGSVTQGDKVEQLASVLRDRELVGPQIVFVGDSPRDHEVARAAGTQFVGVGGDGTAWDSGVATVSHLAALIPRLAPFRQVASELPSPLESPADLPASVPIAVDQGRVFRGTDVSGDRRRLQGVEVEVVTGPDR
ncbi:MAG: HAD hydrolase-like protein [Chloroflexota bacterium]